MGKEKTGAAAARNSGNILLLLPAFPMPGTE